MQNRIMLMRQEQEIEDKNFKKVTPDQKKTLGFRLFFIGNEDSDVEVLEVEKIDFEKVKKRLELGESVFMVTIQPSSNIPDLLTEIDESWYFSRI